MTEEHKPSCACNIKEAGTSCCGSGLEMLPLHQPSAKDVPCCGAPAGPPSSPHERPGYRLCSFVNGFIHTPAGDVPQVKTTLEHCDRRGTLWVRLGFGRNDYTVAPGLYAVGRPDDQSPVMVTANYKLSFDHVRCALAGLNVWVLVLDTCGINVWCAAGKGTFGTRELVYRVQQTRLDQVVQHRRLILPQLGATGVAGHEIKRQCGFEVLWGPVRALDIKTFLRSGQKADDALRRVTFSFMQRLVLVPVEFTLLRKYLLWALAAIVLLSGIGPHIFSISAAWQRGIWALLATVTGIVTGCAVVPILLPWVPGRAFALKGIFAGAALSGPILIGLGAANGFTAWSIIALVLLSTALSSFLAMNFTGSTPFTSPTGVEKEMRRFIPMQLSATVVAIVLWIGAAF